jgi:uncharacterized protein (TIGR03000 family)
MQARRRAAGRVRLLCLAVLFFATAPAGFAQPLARRTPLVIQIVNAAPPAAPDQAPPQPATIEVRLAEDAELWFQGIRMAPTGARRLFTTPPLRPGLAYTYDVFVRWRHDGREVKRTERLSVRAGDALVYAVEPPPPDLGPGYMSVHEIKDGRAYVSARTGDYSSLVELSQGQPLPRRPLPAFVSVNDIEVAAAPGLTPTKPAERTLPASDDHSHGPPVPAQRRREPGFMSIREVEAPPR